MKIIVAILFVCSSSFATSYYVATNGNDANNGSAADAAHAWRNVQKAANTMVAGDTVYVQPGTYNEWVTITTSGSSGSPINYVADGAVIVQDGFSIQGVSYVNVIKFEITHVDLNHNYGIAVSGTCDHIGIYDNYIHDTKSSAISMVAPTDKISFMTVRGNTIYYVGHGPGPTYDVGSVGISTILVNTDHWLNDYNVLQRCPQAFFVMQGTNCVARNNYAWDFLNSYWNASDNTVHADGFQDGSDGSQGGSRHHLYEANTIGDLRQPDGHFMLFQDANPGGYGDTNFLCRGNVEYTAGNGGNGIIAVKKVRYYNNSVYDVTNGPVFNWMFNNGLADPPTGALCVNNLISTVQANSAGTIHIDGGTPNAIDMYNIGFNCPSDSSFVSTADPQYLDPTFPVRDLRISVTSPARNAGTNVVFVTSANGSGTSFTVNDSQLLFDGWNMVAGDLIVVGEGNAPVRITSINDGTSTITVASSQTWTNGTHVFWISEKQKDIGALPYLMTPLTSATISQAGNTYTVTPVGDYRCVFWYTNKVPSHTTYDTTQATFTHGESVSAKVGALYASKTPIIAATSGGGGGGGSGVGSVTIGKGVTIGSGVTIK